MRNALGALLLLSAAFYASNASACRDLIFPKNYEAARERADVIFTGVPQKTVRPAASDTFDPRVPIDFRPPAEVTFKVTNVLKGGHSDDLIVRDKGGCSGLLFFQNHGALSHEEHLVFATLGKDGRYETYFPMPNGPVSDKAVQWFLGKSPAPLP
jgi:hypothetical protein